MRRCPSRVSWFILTIKVCPSPLSGGEIDRVTAGSFGIFVNEGPIDWMVVECRSFKSSY
jgi:hypothetical protein